MSKEMSVIVLGIWIIIVPYLGVPSYWRMVLIILSGIAVAVMGFLLRGQALSRGGRQGEHHPFVENTATKTLHD